MKETINLELSLEHIHPEMIDASCVVEIESYQGSNTSDDPDEINVSSVTISKRMYDSKGQVILDILQDIPVDEQIESEILKKYERLKA